MGGSDRARRDGRPAAGAATGDGPQAVGVPAGDRRVFLGWDESLLPRAARALVERHGTDLADLVVALPGRRALRRFEQHLALVLAEAVGREAPPGAAVAPVPPRLVSVGRLLDELVELERPAAGRLLRTLAWSAALAGLPSRRLALLRHHAPAPGDAPGWLALADEVRTLHAELAAHGLDFAAVRAPAAGLAGEDEALRWDVLAEAQAAFRAELARHGRCDPHEGRRDALRARRWRPERAASRVALIGVAELNVLTRELLAALGERAEVLVFAPESLRPAFDDHGAVVPAAWIGRELPLADADWQLVDRPEDQAAAAVDWIARRADRLAPDEVVVGVPDKEVVPFLERAFEAAGAGEGADEGAGEGAGAGGGARDAEGTPVAHTPPARLLAAVADFLAAPDFAGLAALARHPDLRRALLADPKVCAALVGTASDRSPGPRDLAAALDDYQSERLVLDRPASLAAWPGDEAARRVPVAVSAALDGLLGVLAKRATATDRPAAEWSGPIRDFLRCVYSDLALDPGIEPQRRVMRALQSVCEALDELASLPPDIGSGLGAVDALRLLGRQMQSARVPPPHRDEAVELLGWLELPLDDARALVVTGFVEGCVPGSLKGHAFLPDSLRRKLGLPHDESRLARDAYALELLARGPRELLVISGRRGRAGDPLRPSRLLFHAPGEVALGRALRFGQPEPEPAPAATGATEAPDPPRRELPRCTLPGPRRRVSVTDFGAFLRSPYLSFLERVLRLERGRDDARELDPPAFGHLAHKALEVLGDKACAGLVDAEALSRALRARLAACVEGLYGRRPPPAVRLQQEHLNFRLDALARWQAEQNASGWRIVATEWRPPGGGVPFLVEGGELLLAGRIDRIDVHADSGAWRIIDYKTGDGGESPLRTHGGAKGRPWRDLQLPLYALLVEPLLEELAAGGAAVGEPPALGYVVLPREEPRKGHWIAGPWTPDELQQGQDEARRVGELIRRGEYFSLGRADLQDEVLAAIAGVGFLATPEDEDEEDAVDAAGAEGAG